MADTPVNPASPAPVAPPPVITFDEFSRVDMRVARVLQALPHPNADKLLVLKIDLGSEQRQICAGLVGHYTPEQLVGKNIAVVTNLAPRKMRGELSQGMLLAASSADHARVILLTTDQTIEPGSKIT